MNRLSPLSASRPFFSLLPQFLPSRRTTIAVAPEPAARQSYPITASVAFRRRAKKPPYRARLASAIQAAFTRASGAPVLIWSLPTVQNSTRNWIFMLDTAGKSCPESRPTSGRSEERRVGKEGGGTGKYSWARVHKKK